MLHSTPLKRSFTVAIEMVLREELRDMRSFASLYLFIRILSFTWFQLTFETILFGVSCLVIALIQPYKKTYMNNIDVLILALLTLNSFQLSNFSSALSNQLF